MSSRDFNHVSAFALMLALLLAVGVIEALTGFMSGGVIALFTYLAEASGQTAVLA